MDTLIWLLVAILVIWVVLRVLYKKGYKGYVHYLKGFNIPNDIGRIMLEGIHYESKNTVRFRKYPRLTRIGIDRWTDLTVFYLGIVEKYTTSTIRVDIDLEQSSEHRVSVQFLISAGTDISTDTLQGYLPQWATYWGADSVKVVSRTESAIKAIFVFGDDNFLTETRSWSPEFAEYENVPSKVLMGVDEEGTVVDYSIADTHTLIAGKSGSGKGSIIWNILAPLAGREDTILFGVDLKGGMEFKQNESIFAEPIATEEDQVAELIDRLHEHMEQRMQMLSSIKARKLKPTPETPIIVLAIDEALDLDTMATMKEYKDSMEKFRKILSKGRAVGLTVIAALQNPNVSSFRYSKAFPSKIALRMSSGQQIGFIGSESFEVAKLDSFHQDIKGLCMVTTESGDIRLVKAYYPDDATVQALPESVH